MSVTHAGHHGSWVAPTTVYAVPRPTTVEVYDRLVKLSNDRDPYTGDPVITFDDDVTNGRRSKLTEPELRWYRGWTSLP